MRENKHANIVNYVDSYLVGEELWVFNALKLFRILFPHYSYMNIRVVEMSGSSC